MSQQVQVIALLTATSGAPIMNEGTADAATAIVPGMLVSETATGVAENAAAGIGAKLFADTNPANGSTIDTVYPVGDRVRYGAYHSGQEVNALVAAGAAAVAKGDPVTSAGDGTLITGTAANAIGYALEAVDNSGGATLARLPIRIA